MFQPISSYRNNCTLVMLKLVTGRSDADITEAAARNGWKPHRGMHDIQWKRAARELGVVYRAAGREFSLRVAEYYGTDCFGAELFSSAYTLFINGHKKDDRDCNGRKKIREMTLNEFLRVAEPGKTYVVGVDRHVFVVCDGIVIDKNYYQFGGKRKVKKIIEVTNPACQSPRLGMYVRAVRKKFRKSGKALLAFSSIRNYVSGQYYVQQNADPIIKYADLIRHGKTVGYGRFQLRSRERSLGEIRHLGRRI